MIKFAICDDDKEFCEIEKKYIEHVIQDRFPQIPISIDIYYDGNEILDQYPILKQDVVFLDIELGDQNGFDVARVLNKVNSRVDIVFITTHNNLIYDSFEYRPMGFVDKLHFDKEFERVMKRMIRDMITQHRMIELGKDKNSIQLLCDKIHMVEAFKHEIIVRCENGDLTIKDQFGNNVEKLSASGFLLVSRGVMVNKQFIRTIDGRQVILYDGTVVSIGRSRYKQVKEEFEHEKVNRLIGI